MTAPAPLDGLIGFQLRLAQLKFFAAFFDEFGADASPAEYAILALIHEAPGLRQGVLANRLHIKRSNMTKLMRALEGRGLARRAASKSDGRAFEVYPTERGEALRARLAAGMHAHDRAAAAALTAHEQDALLALLAKLTTTGANTREKEDIDG